MLHGEVADIDTCEILLILLKEPSVLQLIIIKFLVVVYIWSVEVIFQKSVDSYFNFVVVSFYFWSYNDIFIAATIFGTAIHYLVVNVTALAVFVLCEVKLTLRIKVYYLHIMSAEHVQ